MTNEEKNRHIIYIQYPTISVERCRFRGSTKNAPRTDGRMEGQMDRRDGWTGRRAGRQMDGEVHIYRYSWTHLKT